MVRVEVIYCAILPMEIDNADTSPPNGKIYLDKSHLFPNTFFSTERYSRGVLRCTASKKKVGVKDAGIMYPKNTCNRRGWGGGGVARSVLFGKEGLERFKFKYGEQQQYALT